MPSRTIKESHRPRASDRTMHCHSSSGQSYRLVVSENDGRRHNSEMEPQGRTIASPSRTRRQSKTLCLEKTALRVRNYVQIVGLNAETKKDRHRAAGEIFVLTFPLIGLTGFRTSRALRPEGRAFVSQLSGRTDDRNRLTSPITAKLVIASRHHESNSGLRWFVSFCRCRSTARGQIRSQRRNPCKFIRKT